MKRSLFSFVFLALLSALFLSSCQESDNPVDNGSLSELQLSKEQILLSSAASIDSSYVSLVCGCRFTLSVEGFSGDTSAIHFEQYDASTAAYRVAVKFTGDQLAAPGIYSAKLALRSSGSKGTYRDTIKVEYTR